MKEKLIVLSGLVLGSPLAALAQGGATIAGTQAGGCSNVGNAGTLFGILCRVGQFLNAVVPVLIALGVVYFVFGVITYVIASDEEAKTTGRNRIIAGIIGLAVIIALWGLVKILTNTFGLTNRVNVELPTVNTQQQY